MLGKQSEIFIDRQEAIALFNSIRGRDPEKAWPLLPILAFIAPGGSGKSTLINHLRTTYCSLLGPEKRAVLPYALIDFTLASAPKDFLSILVVLRNQLQQLEDGQGRHLLFPRFDLGAAIVLGTPVDGNLPLLSEKDIRQSIRAGLPFFGPLGEMGSALGNSIPVIPPLMVGLKWATQLEPLQKLLQRLERGPGWRWYRDHSIDVGLSAYADVREVLLRLYQLSIPGMPGREDLVVQLLPEAMLADLCDALDGLGTPSAWSKTANVVLFLDGFEMLLEGSGSTGIRLLVPSLRNKAPLMSLRYMD